MKTYVFDAGALFAFLRKSPGAPKINEVIKEAVRGRARVLMSAGTSEKCMASFFERRGRNGHEGRYTR